MRLSRIEVLARAAGCTDLQVWTLLRLAEGRTVADIATARGVSERGVWKTRASAFKRILAQAEGLDKPLLTERQRDVVELRDTRANSWTWIAVELGISRTTAIRHYQRAQNRIAGSQ